jgi:hypothetical protein
MRRAALLTAFAATLLASAPGFAFEAQSGGVLLSPQATAQLVNRLAGKADAARQPGQGRDQRAERPVAGQPPAQAADRPALPPWLGEASDGRRDEDPRRRLLGLMFGDPGTAAAKGGLAGVGGRP